VVKRDILPRYLAGDYIGDMPYRKDRNSSFNNNVAVPEANILYIYLNVLPLYYPYSYPSFLKEYEISVLRLA
jgi:hypothetical protein